MANAARDVNQVTVLMGVSDADGVTPLPVRVDPATGRVLFSSTFGSGSGITSINADATAAQVLLVGTAGTDFAIVDDAAGNHTFNLPSASATARGLVTTGAQTIAGAKTFSSTIVGSINGNAATVTTNANLTGAITSTGNATVLGSFTSAQLLAALTDETGTGSAVFATSPTLVTPLLGTPTSGVLTNCTGLPVASGISGLGTGVATFLATPSSANLASAITDETGSGALVFGTNPTIAKPVMNARNQTAQTYSPAGAGTATLDLSLADQHYITMPAGNITIALSNDTNNQIFYVTILQDGTGSRTVTWFTTIRWAGGSAPTLTTTASKRDAFIFVRTGSGTYDGFIVGQNI